MDSVIVFPVYVLVKYLAYSAWCYFGLRRLRQRKSIASGLGFGSARLGLGILFGAGIFLVGGSLHLNSPAHPWLMYLSIYAPVRYVEWSIMAALLGSAGGQVFKIGDWATQRWILGGIVVSHLADLPMIISSYHGPMDFLPVGRFLC
jgi:ABC-type Na+ efflux pump permease subunit